MPMTHGPPGKSVRETLSYVLVPRWDVKRWRGCVFSPPSLLPVPGRGKEADSAASTNKSFPIPLLSSFVAVHIKHLFNSYLRSSLTAPAAGTPTTRRVMTTTLVAIAEATSGCSRLWRPPNKRPPSLFRCRRGCSDLRGGLTTARRGHPWNAGCDCVAIAFYQVNISHEKRMHCW